LVYFPVLVCCTKINLATLILVLSYVHIRVRYEKPTSGICIIVLCDVWRICSIGPCGQT
jgi:hypothetical protein